jgi:hypothetical protein
MPANKELFQAITMGYTKYSQTQRPAPQSNAATEIFIGILNTNGINMEDDDIGTDDQTKKQDNALQLQKYSQPLTSEQEKNIAIALSEYCFAGGGPLYDEIKNNVKPPQKFADEETDEGQESEKNKDREETKKPEINIKHNIELLDAPIVIENLDHQNAIQFLNDSLAQKADSDHCALWLFLLLNKIITPEKIINDHTFMSYWHDQTNKYLSYITSMRGFKKDLAIFFKEPYTALHGEILSVPHIRKQNATRLQEAAFVCSAGGRTGPTLGYTQEIRKEAKDLIIKMLQIPGLSVTYEPGNTWIEILICSITEKDFEEILAVIPAPMLETFYQKNLHNTLLEKCPDYLTARPFERTQYHHRYSLILKILEGKNTDSDQALKATVANCLEITQQLPRAEVTAHNKPAISSYTEYFKKQLDFFKIVEATEDKAAEKNILQIAYLTANTIYLLTRKRSSFYDLKHTYDIIVNPILAKHPELQSTMATNSDFMVRIRAALYGSITQSFIDFDNVHSLLCVDSSNSVDYFIELIDYLDANLVGAKNNDPNRIQFRFLHVDALLGHPQTLKIFTSVFKKMLLSANEQQAARLKSSPICPQMGVANLGNEAKSTLENIFYAIAYHSPSSVPRYYIARTKFTPMANIKDLIVSQITASIRHIKPYIDYDNREILASLKELLDLFIKTYSLDLLTFEEDIRVFYKFLSIYDKNALDNDASNITLANEHDIFMRSIQQKAALYKSSWSNWMKSIANSGESLRLAESIVALPYNNQNENTKKSSLVKAIIMLISYRLMSYQSDSHRKTFYFEDLKSAFEKLSKTPLSEIHKKVILSEMERALNVPNLAFQQNDDRFKFLGLDLGFFIGTFDLDMIQVNEILVKSKFHALSGTTGPSSLNTNVYGKMMLDAASGKPAQLQSGSSSNSNLPSGFNF